ncbi:WXG100 family type VII secretion target [Nocardiopsis sp. RSe5-2]|uniref:WXG100 family type VII secretion target n=1 Tax=Nocardiopsis endophytica TaxID=3018445 RepID=A0ABT4TX03_9ACTN|nr:WXG100 family type VII secretion target [Nocardiopsis endophytica]MDA2809216.1 WXG100 family type VII secretion target [Nocardiopsis endophytica]
MSFDGFEIKKSGAQTAGLDLRQQTEVIANAIEELDRRVRRVKDGWVGEAADQYDVRIANWRKNVEDMRTLLNQAQVSLDDIVDRYNRGDLQEAGNWSQRR